MATPQCEVKLCCGAFPDFLYFPAAFPVIKSFFESFCYTKSFGLGPPTVKISADNDVLIVLFKFNCHVRSSGDAEVHLFICVNINQHQ